MAITMGKGDQILRLESSSTLYEQPSSSVNQLSIVGTENVEAMSIFICENLNLLAPTGALVVMMVYYISAAAAAATFSDFHSVH